MSESELQRDDAGKDSVDSEAASQTCVSGPDLAMLVLRLLGANFFIQGVLALSRITFYAIQSRGFSLMLIGGDLVALLFYAIVGAALWRWARPWGNRLFPSTSGVPLAKMGRKSFPVSAFLSAGLSFLAVMVAVINAIPGIIGNAANFFVASRFRSLDEAMAEYGSAMVRDGVLLVVAAWLFRSSRKLAAGWEVREQESRYVVEIESSWRRPSDTE